MVRRNLFKGVPELLTSHICVCSILGNVCAYMAVLKFLSANPYMERFQVVGLFCAEPTCYPIGRVEARLERTNLKRSVRAADQPEGIKILSRGPV